MVSVGHRYRSREPLSVTCWWELDTVAILDDYSECCEAALPVGESFTVIEIAESDPSQVLCKLDREKGLKNQLIPRKRQNRLWIIPLPTPYGVEIARTDINNRCEQLSGALPGRDAC